MTHFFVLLIRDLWDVAAKLQGQGIGGDPFWGKGAGAVVQKYYSMLIGNIVPPPDQRNAPASVGPASLDTEDEEAPEPDEEDEEDDDSTRRL